MSTYISPGNYWNKYKWRKCTKDEIDAQSALKIWLVSAAMIYVIVVSGIYERF